MDGGARDFDFPLAHGEEDEDAGSRGVDFLPSRLREGPGVGTVEGIRRPTARARQLRREATPAERALWHHVRGSVLGHRFNRQMPVGPYICDFMCRSRLLIVELDGFSHDIRSESDEARTRFLRSRGFEILRFSNRQVLQDVEGVVRAISLALAEPSPPPTPPASGRGE